MKSMVLNLDSILSEALLSTVYSTLDGEKHNGLLIFYFHVDDRFGGATFH